MILSRRVISPFLMILSLFVCQALQASVLNLASDVWPPYTDEEGNKAISIELVHKALESIGYKAETTIIPTDDLVASVETGPFDGSVAFWDDKQREQYLYYSEPYLQNRLVLVTRKDQPVDVTLDSLKRKNVGITVGYSYGLDTSAEDGPEYIGLEGVEEIVSKLNSGEIDYGIVDELVYHYYSSHEAPEKTTELHAAEEPIIRRKLYFVLRKEVPGAQKLMARFNHAVDQLKKNGSYNRILNVDWIEIDINNDGIYELLFGGEMIESLSPSSSFKIFK